MIKVKAVGIALLLAAGMAFTATPAQAAPAAAGPPHAPTANGTVKPAGVKLNPAKGITKGRPPMAGQKAPKVAFTPCATACYTYTEQHQDLSTSPANSVSTGFRVENTYLSLTSNNSTGQNAGHTLEELAINKTAAGTGDTAEIGITKDPTVNSGHPTEPSLFVFSWTGGVGNGYNGGGGWVNSSTCVTDNVCPGTSLLSLVGTTHTFGWQHLDVSSGVDPGWWAYVDTHWVGHYPDATWPSGYTAAGYVQTFGELAGDQNGDQSCADIGSGDVPAAGVGGRATNLTFTGTTIAPGYTASTVTSPTRYTVFSTSATAFNFGGPGSNSIAEALGTKGSCASPTAGTPAASSFQLYKEACPDLSITTGCTNGQAFTTSIAVGVCTPITGAGTTEVNGVKNNAGVSGRTYSIYRTAGCTGTAKTYANGAQEAFTTASGWSRNAIRAVKRNS